MVLLQLRFFVAIFKFHMVLDHPFPEKDCCLYITLMVLLVYNDSLLSQVASTAFMKTAPKVITCILVCLSIVNTFLGFNNPRKYIGTLITTSITLYFCTVILVKINYSQMADQMGNTLHL